MQCAIARPIAFTTDIVQLLQQVAQLIKILQPDNVLVGNSLLVCLTNRWPGPYCASSNFHEASDE